MLEARINGSICFGDLDYEEAKVYLDKLLLSGCAITGSPLPSTEFFADVISKEIYIFLNDFGYGEFSFEEILLALRINANGGIKDYYGNIIESIEFTGCVFNVNFLAGVLDFYQNVRIGFKRKLQNYLDGHIH